MAVNVTVGTATNKKQLLVAVDTKISAIIAEAKIAATNPTYNLNGMGLSARDMSATLEELGVEDGTNAMLLAVVKADSAK